MRIGVLALQGAFIEHAHILNLLNVEPVLVRLPSDLNGIKALIVPGGESTTISKQLADYSLMEPIRNLIIQGLPVLGTCAGMILLAKKILDSDVEPLGVIDIEIQRNAYGRQIDSFEVALPMSFLGKKTFRGIFIRAPIIKSIKPNVEILSQFNNEAVAVKQGNRIACSFHPELTEDLRFHKYFLNLAAGEISFATGNS